MKRDWTPIKQYEEILFDQFGGIARITINRERYRNPAQAGHRRGQRLCHRRRPCTARCL